MKLANQYQTVHSVSCSMQPPLVAVYRGTVVYMSHYFHTLNLVNYILRGVHLLQRGPITSNKH